MKVRCVVEFNPVLYEMGVTASVQHNGRDYEEYASLPAGYGDGELEAAKNALVEAVKKKVMEGQG